MSKKFSLIIFTDLDGSLLHRDNFRFDQIKDYLKKIIDDGIIIIPNTSKTESEIEEFMKDLGSNLPFISSNLKLSLCNKEPSKSVKMINENFLLKKIYLILFLFLSKNKTLSFEKDIVTDFSLIFSDDLIIIWSSNTFE